MCQGIRDGSVIEFMRTQLSTKEVRSPGRLIPFQQAPLQGATGQSERTKCGNRPLSMVFLANLRIIEMSYSGALAPRHPSTKLGKEFQWAHGVWRLSILDSHFGMPFWVAPKRHPHEVRSSEQSLSAKQDGPEPNATRFPSLLGSTLGLQSQVPMAEGLCESLSLGSTLFGLPPPRAPR